ncbi:TRAP transporter large permease [Martelella soudanensis]|uniref:TRAP transporter large permease n=1 Tax=unclassified Martelella TaxID=2629616 RepID=UPI0015DF504E|nr:MULTISPECIES: TRAP transporter large permease [unclassified Martelella]
MELSLIGFAILLSLCFLGFPLGFTTLLVGLVGFAYTRDWNFAAAFTMSSQQIMESGANYGLSVIPLFIVMGAFIHRSNISEDLFRAAYALVGARPGGLAHATVLACAGFSAVSGSSLATAATMTRVAMPHMRRYGYDDRLSSGVVAAGGTLGIMIPPSVPLVIYALVAEQDVGKLFVAAFIPGILLVALYLGAVAISVWLKPGLGRAGAPMSRAERLAAYARVWPIVALFIIVLGGIYFGICSPTEAAGIGAVGAAAFAVMRGYVRSVAALYRILIESCRTTAMLFVVIFGAQVFANFINLTGLPYELVSIVETFHLGPLGLVLSICLISIVMGMIFDSIGILLLIVPVFLPSLLTLDVNLVWFGIIMIVVVEMGLITPPIGMNVFTVRSVMPDIRLGAIFSGVVSFVIADAVALAILIAFPIVALGLLAW